MAFLNNYIKRFSNVILGYICPDRQADDNRSMLSAILRALSKMEASCLNPMLAPNVASVK